MWILLAFLIAGAASYVQGTRYSLAGHPPAAASASSETGFSSMAMPSVPSEESQAGAPSSFSSSVPAVFAGSASQDEKPLEGACCERRQAPRAEPAPLRIASAHSAATLQHWTAGQPLSSPPMPPEPDLPTLTVVELAVSRT